MIKRLPNNPTLKSVALVASVSVPTVSRVLNGAEEIRVTPSTRKRIIDAAKELRYRPNVLARSLKLRQTFSLALFVSTISNPVFPQIIQGVEDAAQKHGYSVLMGT